MTGRQTNNQVSDEGVFSFSGSVRYHSAPAVGLGQVVRGDGFGHATDLVDLQQQAIASLAVNGSLDTLGVGDSKIVANNLDRGVGSQRGPGAPVILVEGIFNGDHRVGLDEVLVDFLKFAAVQPLAGIGLGVLEVQVVFA